MEPLLKQNLASILQHLGDSFPPAAACQAQQQGGGSTTSLHAGQPHKRQLMLVDSDDEEAEGELTRSVIVKPEPRRATGTE